jgi:hypothetical protein
MDPGNTFITPRFNRVNLFQRYNGMTLVTRRDNPHMVFDNESLANNMSKLTREIDREAASRIRQDVRLTGYEKQQIQGSGTMCSPYSNDALVQKKSVAVETPSTGTVVVRDGYPQPYVMGDTPSGTGYRRGRPPGVSRGGSMALVTTGNKRQIVPKKASRGRVISRFA